MNRREFLKLPFAALSRQKKQEITLEEVNFKVNVLGQHMVNNVDPALTILMEDYVQRRQSPHFDKNEGGTT